MPAVKPKIIVVDNVYRKSKEIFDSLTDLEVVVSTAEEHALAKIIKETRAFAAIVDVERYNDEFYEAFERGGVVARFGVGYDGIILEKIKAKKLILTNTPGILESTVAEFTVLLAGEVARKVGASSEKLKSGEWPRFLGKGLHGKKWAILGFGKIGKKLCDILKHGFGMQVSALVSNQREVDHFKNATDQDVHLSTVFEEAVANTDFVSLHLPANDHTYHFIDKAKLKLLKPEAILINTGRGILIDECALYDALVANRISGAGLDVFHHEPYVPIKPEYDLRKLKNVVMTPHIASSTKECAEKMAHCVLQNIRYAIHNEYDKMDIVCK